MDKAVSIVAVGANPAWQKVLKFSKFTYDEVNRAYEMWAFASGKGINFARAAKVWDKAQVQVVQFAGGDNGRLLLDDLKRENLGTYTVETAVPTRCCITCLSDSDNTMTELIEPSGVPGQSEQQQALAYIENAMKNADGMALCGQLPNGMDVAFYECCVKIAAAENAKLLIDSWKGIAPVLAACSSGTLKINKNELSALTGVEDVYAAAGLLLNSHALEYVAVTAGAGRAHFFARGRAWSYEVPKLPRVVNPVGSGDTTSAVYLSEITAGEKPEVAFAKALAAASANCLTMKCGEFDRCKAEEFFHNINISETEF